MPHIEGKRILEERAVFALTENSIKPDGKLNYVLVRLFVETILKQKMSYNKTKEYIGELTEAAAYIRHRWLVHNYEREKSDLNGDVFGIWDEEKGGYNG